MEGLPGVTCHMLAFGCEVKVGAGLPVELPCHLGYLWAFRGTGYLGEARQVCVTCRACWRARFRPLMAGVAESRENNGRLSCFVANLAPPPR